MKKIATTKSSGSQWEIAAYSSWWDDIKVILADTETVSLLFAEYESPGVAGGLRPLPLRIPEFAAGDALLAEALSAKRIFTALNGLL
ncbi:hypothetical protein [Desulfonema ishimotonii]|uniref:hypothetical protein n=1 Tax=Desulfonema ishimotonii TaxID=45657 RepID=UPI000F56C4AA|nr:hypothetical protein [Desulfonema ishimotonii]